MVYKNTDIRTNMQRRKNKNRETERERGWQMKKQTHSYREQTDGHGGMGELGDGG